MPCKSGIFDRTPNGKHETQRSEYLQWIASTEAAVGTTVDSP